MTAYHEDMDEEGFSFAPPVEVPQGRAWSAAWWCVGCLWAGMSAALLTVGVWWPGAMLVAVAGWKVVGR